MTKDDPDDDRAAEKRGAGVEMENVPRPRQVGDEVGGLTFGRITAADIPRQILSVRYQFSERARASSPDE
jgi:hypothetical protein